MRRVGRSGLTVTSSQTEVLDKRTFWRSDTACWKMTPILLVTREQLTTIWSSPTPVGNNAPLGSPTSHLQCLLFGGEHVLFGTKGFLELFIWKHSPCSGRTTVAWAWLYWNSLAAGRTAEQWADTHYTLAVIMRRAHSTHFNLMVVLEEKSEGF